MLTGAIEYIGQLESEQRRLAAENEQLRSEARLAKGKVDVLQQQILLMQNNNASGSDAGGGAMQGIMRFHEGS